MLLLPLQTPTIKTGDDLSKILSQNDIQDGDIIAVSSKVVAAAEGAAIDLSKCEVSEEAQYWFELCGKTAEFRQAVLDETKRMHGSVLGHCENAMLTEIKPDGLQSGTILTANAGLDSSNIDEGFAIGWPHDPVASSEKLIKEIGKDIGILITDSCCRPRRIGVIAFAITCTGFSPLVRQRGKEDLFGRELRMTQEALADQLATATNMIMGNANQSTPAVIVRDHNIPFSDFSGWVPGMDREKDLFRGAL